MPDSEGKHRPFNPHRVPNSEECRRFCDHVRQMVEAHEAAHGLRGRKRNRRDQRVFDQTITALICDVLHHAVAFVKTGQGKSAVNAKQGIRISLSHKELGRDVPNRHAVYSKQLPDIVKRLAACGFLDMTLGRPGYKPFDVLPHQTLLRPTRLLIDLATGRTPGPDGSTFNVKGFDDLTLDYSGTDCIVLRAPKVMQGDKVIVEELAFKETRLTKRLRAEMTAINEWLTFAPLSVDHTALSPHRAALVDPTKRFLVRKFTYASFESGGRLVGGFWQNNIDNHDRKRAITIAGEAVCILDYSQMGPRILYGMNGKQPPADCYMIHGCGYAREGMKAVFNAAMYLASPPKRFPKGTRKDFLKRVKFPDVLEQLRKEHDAVWDCLFSPRLIGHKVQNVESNIMVDVLLALKEAGFAAALPIHDAIIVPSSRSAEARETMQTVFYKHTGITALVHEE